MKCSLKLRFLTRRISIVYHSACVYCIPTLFQATCLVLEYRSNKGEFPTWSFIFQWESRQSTSKTNE